MSFLLTPILYLILVLPFYLIGKKKAHAANEYRLLFAGYVILDMALTALPIDYPAFDFVGLQMNWSGKIYSYLLAILFILFYKKISRKEIGLTLEQHKGSQSFSIWTMMVFIGLMLAYCVFLGRFQATTENILFQITMPSVIEEIVFRGILLALLARVFEDNLRIGQVKFGMGVIITSLLFGFWHGLHISDNFELTLNWLPVVYTGLIVFVLALVRVRSGSLVFPIIIHILVNLIPQVMGYVF